MISASPYRRPLPSTASRRSASSSSPGSDPSIHRRSQGSSTVAANKKLLILAGDGIGPEVMRQVERVLDWYAKRRAVSFGVSHGLVGGCSYDKHGTPLTDEAMGEAMESDAVLLGAVG